MEEITKSPFKKRKKISLNVSTEILGLVEELAKLTKTNNTLIIESLLVNGFSPLIKQFKTSWITLLGNTKNKEKKETIKKLLEELKIITEKEEYKIFISS
jgi:hypothetical protein